MENSQNALVGEVLFKIAVDADAASHLHSGQLHMMEGVLALALERIRAELLQREALKESGRVRIDAN